MVDVFKCPACGAPLEPPADSSPSVACKYCHNIVTVPAELRRAQVMAQAEEEFPELSPLLDQMASHSAEIREMAQLARSGKKIEAIKLYRQVFGVGLQEAKDAIDQLEATGRLEITQTQVTGDGAALSEAQAEEIAQILREGNKIEAIRRYRELNGAGLKEAKDAVEQIEKRQTPYWLGAPGSDYPLPPATIETPPFPPADIGVPEKKPGSARFWVTFLVVMLMLTVLAITALIFFSIVGR